MNGLYNAPRIFVLLVILVWIPFLCALPQQGLDSLRGVVNRMEKTTERVDNLLVFARMFYDSVQYDSSLYYTEEARISAIKIGYTKGEAESHYMKCLNYERLDNPPVSIDHARKYLSLVRTLNDSMLLGRATYQVGRAFNAIGLSDSVVFYNKISIGISRKLNNTRGLMANYNLLGNTFKQMNEYDSAVFFYMKALEIAEEKGLTNFLSSIYRSLGQTMMKAEQADKARFYLELSLKYIDKSLDPDLHFQLYFDLVNISIFHGKYEEALLYYDTVSEILKDKPLEIAKANLSHNRGFVYMKLGQFEKALKYIEAAQGVFARLEFYPTLIQAYRLRGEIYSELGQYERARILLDSAMALAEIIQGKELKMDVYQLMALNYSRMGNHVLAYQYQVQYSDIFEEVYTHEKDSLITNISLKYEKEKDQAEIFRLQNANLAMELDLSRKTAQRNSYLGGALAILILGLFLFLYLRQRVIIARQRIVQLEEENKLMEARLLIEGQELERKRIAQELHDGLGVLLSATRMQFTSIGKVSPENRPLIDKATQLLEQASGDVRKISHNMMPGLLTKLGLYEAVEDLIDNINDGENISAVCEVTGEHVRMSENKEIMVFRIIQEMVNNSLKHADATKIELKVKTSPEKLLLIYSDDGKGFEVEKALHHDARSFGLRNMQSRVNFLNGEMDIRTRPGEGVTYTLEIPV